ncbi:hypothetical protein B0O99DRAFT_594958 [Bisporella sp. PMI_857]|nr:hypothetical protein B0O99DRAFT_594958 [Bisporella sp. PMI_857]
MAHPQSAALATDFESWEGHWTFGSGWEQSLFMVISRESREIFLKVNKKVTLRGPKTAFLYCNPELDVLLINTGVWKTSYWLNDRLYMLGKKFRSTACGNWQLLGIVNDKEADLPKQQTVFSFSKDVIKRDRRILHTNCRSGLCLIDSMGKDWTHPRFTPIYETGSKEEYGVEVNGSA